jgi:hypothetical protein
MFRSILRSARCAALMLVAAAAPSLALSLSVLPAHPVEETPFTLVIGLVGSCPAPDTIEVKPGNPGVVIVKLDDICLSPPIEQLVEIPIGPLPAGPWNLRVHFGNQQETLQVNVEPLPFNLEVDPPHPQAGSPFIVRLTGNADCPHLGPVVQSGNLLTLRYFDSCPILPPPPAPFVIEETLGPLSAGDYVVQVVDAEGHVLASRRFHVYAGHECAPSATALCLLQGRFRVEAAWRTATDRGAARAHPETADSGAFWFFGPDNLELLVKVLDACPTPSQHVWVYAAGLTDVEVELTVTEMATGRKKTYRNPLGRPFAPILDTAAFGCF